MARRIQNTVAWATLCLFAAVSSLDEALHLPIYGSYFCPELAAAKDVLGLHRGRPAKVAPSKAVFDSDETCPICKFSGEGKVLVMPCSV